MHDVGTRLTMTAAQKTRKLWHEMSVLDSLQSCSLHHLQQRYVTHYMVKLILATMLPEIKKSLPTTRLGAHLAAQRKWRRPASEQDTTPPQESAQSKRAAYRESHASSSRDIRSCFRLGLSSCLYCSSFQQLAGRASCDFAHQARFLFHFVPHLSRNL